MITVGRLWWTNKWGVYSSLLVFSGGIGLGRSFSPHGAGRVLGESFMYARDNMGIGLRG